MNEGNGIVTPPDGPARLVGWARACIAANLGATEGDEPRGEWFEQVAATFVTLYREGELHGCIGTLRAHRPLVEDVRHNAVAAAFLDPRAMPLELQDVPALDIEISHLSDLEPIDFASEQDLLGQLRPGIDGVLLRCGAARGTFLPQVWEKIPGPADFLAELKRKAGLPSSYWSSQMCAERYTVRRYSDAGEIDHA